MQIALTKKLADAIGIKPISASDSIDPLFCWTANWINTFDRRKEDMVVLVNNATQFTVTIYGIKHNQFKDISAKILTAIRNTLTALYVAPEIIDEYLQKAGEVSFASNHDRKLTAQVNRRGLDAAFIVGRAVNDSSGKMKYEDTLGLVVSNNPVNYSGNHENGFIPREKMLDMLSNFTGKPVYKYRAFELSITLDLEIYKAVRKIIVPADLEFSQLHKVLQDVFDWKNYHLYDFAIFDDKKREAIALLVSHDEYLEYDNTAILMGSHKLSEYLPQNKSILYTYDMGDDWEHKIELVRVIDEHHEQSPYLLEADGQTPPEDVGGVGGYIDFRKIMLDPNHPEYDSTKKWCGYWSLELSEHEQHPRVIDY